MYDLCGSLESHEDRMKRSSGQSLEQAFQSKVNLGRKIQQKRGNFQHQDQFQRSQNNQPRGHGRDQGRGRNTQLQRTSSQGQNCIICKMSNHTSDMCRICVGHTTWRVIDQMRSQRLRTPLRHGQDTNRTRLYIFHRFFFYKFMG